MTSPFRDDCRPQKWFDQKKKKLISSGEWNKKKLRISLKFISDDNEKNKERIAMRNDYHISRSYIEEDANEKPQE